MNNRISDGKVIIKSNRKKDSYWINLDLIDITAESTLNFLMIFYPTHPLLPISSPKSHLEPTANGPTPDFETP